MIISALATECLMAPTSARTGAARPAYGRATAATLPGDFPYLLLALMILSILKFGDTRDKPDVPGVAVEVDAAPKLCVRL